MTTARAGRPRPATYEDLRAVPGHQVAEILGGELVVLPRPTGQHATASDSVFSRAHRRYDDGDDGPGGWWIRHEVELLLGPDVLVPDLVGWRRSRMPRPPSGPFQVLAPDWVCEVLSAPTRGVDRVRKMRTYAREGVAHAWLVDPEARTIEVFALAEGSWRLVVAHEGEETVRAEPFPEAPIGLPRLWGERPGGPASPQDPSAGSPPGGAP